jgi:hypothetical protein
MKIVIMGDDHKGMFSRLADWFTVAGHDAVLHEKFGPRGDPENCDPCPIEDPDIILAMRYVTWEELPKMGIVGRPIRVFQNLGNKDISALTNDWRVESFNDYYVSYNPMHKNYPAPSGKPGKYRNLKFLPLPFFADLPQYDYSNSPLSFSQAISGTGMANAYNKQTGMITSACKENGVPLELIFDKTTQEALTIKSFHSASFDNLLGMFGVTTLESMKMGQAVICHVEPEILDAYEELLGMRPPVIQATTYDELVSVIGQMKSGEIDWKAKCIEGRQFIQTAFAPPKIVKCYLDYFTQLLGG